VTLLDWAISCGLVLRGTAEDGTLHQALRN